MKQVVRERQAVTDVSRILVVGDQLPLLTSMQALLQINGYAADLAFEQSDAMTRLKQQRYGLLLIDLHLPGLGANKLFELISQSETEPEMIVLSSDAAFASIKNSVYLGTCTFVRKPYRAEELLVAVSHGLERRQYRQQLLRAKQALAESERMHRFIVNRSPDFIYMLDSAGNFTFVNDMVEGVLSYKRHELLGQHFSRIIHPHNAEAAQRFFSEQRTGERAAKRIEMRLQPNQEDCQKSNREAVELVVEVNALGLYTQDVNGNRVFSGTLGSVRDITERKRSEAQVNYHAFHDPLTRLPNRLLFTDRMNQALAHALRHQQKFTLMFTDIDRFKEINDTYGHVIGDQVLKKVAARVLECIRAEDTLSRFGGDEFALLLTTVERGDDAIAVAEKILTAVRRPLKLDETELRLNLSLGIALYPDAGENAEELLHSADIAMYQVKADGRGNYCLYRDEMGRTSKFTAFRQDLEKALEKGQLQVFFQPKVDPDSHIIVGMEALLRWQHPVRGLLYPVDFIVAAEKSRQIIPVGAWVLTTVCEEMVRWQHQHLPQIRVSLNVSSVQLEEEDYVDRFISTIKSFGIEPERFEIQVTEQGILDGQHRIIKNLQALRQLGVNIAIDDFGCGNSSLNYLRNFPVNTLMIDRSFVRDIVEDDGHSRVADGIAMMAKGMNLNLVAKGVENMLQLDHLRRLGCHEVQGYLYGEAISAAATLDLLRTRPTTGPHFSLPLH